MQTEVNGNVNTIDLNKANLEDEVNKELDRIGQGSRWVWKLFIIGSIPNILNGFHVASYVFFGKIPDSFWCEIPALNNTSWTHEQMLRISTKSQGPRSCGIINRDYTTISSMNYTNTMKYTFDNERLPTIPCSSLPGNKMQYVLKGSSIVSEWNLVCENSLWRTIIQVMLSLGKCLGGTIVGIMSDKYGRKKLFGIGCGLFTFASLLTAFSPWYWSFLIGRFIFGLSAPAMFFTSLIMMTENVAARHRAWVGIAFQCSYSLGMVYLAAAAWFLPNWRDLQLALSVPALVFVVILYYFKESPRWLLSKGRIEQAYKVVFNKTVDTSTTAYNQLVSRHSDDGHKTLEQSKGMFFEISGLYRTKAMRQAAIICHLGFFTATFSYYVTAINAVNLSANPVIYVSATGLVDIFGYISSILVLIYCGRKWGCFCFYALAAVCLLVILLVPQDEKTVVVWIAMAGRLGASGAYAIIGLYTTELFPTEVRNSAIGVSSMFGHVGSMMAPFVVDYLGDVAWFIPTTICGVALLLAALMILLNPETSQIKLVDHMDGKPASST